MSKELFIVKVLTQGHLETADEEIQLALKEILEMYRENKKTMCFSDAIESAHVAWLTKFLKY